MNVEILDYIAVTHENPELRDLLVKINNKQAWYNPRYGAKDFLEDELAACYHAWSNFEDNYL